MVWTLIEPGLAIMASSLVTIRPLLHAWKVKGFHSTNHSYRLGRSTHSHIQKKITSIFGSKNTTTDTEMVLVAHENEQSRTDASTTEYMELPSPRLVRPKRLYETPTDVRGAPLKLAAGHRSQSIQLENDTTDYRIFERTWDSELHPWSPGAGEMFQIQHPGE